MPTRGSEATPVETISQILFCLNGPMRVACQFSGYCRNSGFFIFFPNKSGGTSFVRLAKKNRLYRVGSVSLGYQDILNFSFLMPSGVIHSDISPTEVVRSLR